MLPRVKPLVTAAPLFCLWKPIIAPLPAELLSLYSWKLLEKEVFALISRVLLLLVPMTTLPSRLVLLLAMKPPVRLTASEAADVKTVVAAFTIKL